MFQVTLHNLVRNCRSMELDTEDKNVCSSCFLDNWEMTDQVKGNVTRNVLREHIKWRVEINLKERNIFFFS